MRTRPRGEATLKGLGGPVTLWSATWDDHRAGALFPLPKRLVADDRLVFSGRASELRAPGAALERVADGEPGVVFVSGEPGAGKTRLVSELAANAHDAAAIVLYGACDEDFTTPFQPFVELLDWYFARADDAPLGPMAGDLRGSRRDLPSRSHPALPLRTRSMINTGSSNRSRRGSRRSLVRSQWSSSSTTSTGRPSRRSSCSGTSYATWPTRQCLYSLRTETRTSSAHDRSPGCSASCGGCAVPSASCSVASDATGIAELLERNMAAAIEGDVHAFPHTLVLETEGNPLFIGEVLRNLVEAGHLVQSEGLWSSAVLPRATSRSLRASRA